MGLSKRKRFSINGVIITISILVWGVLLFNPGNMLTVDHCKIFASSFDDSLIASNNIPEAAICYTPPENFEDAVLQWTTAMEVFSSQLFGWLLMVVAMMLPKLMTPIQLIYQRSLKRKRLISIHLFVAGYVAVWTVAGILMSIIIIGIGAFMQGSYTPAIILGIIAIIWQCSPWKQLFLNLGHDHKNLSAFGWKALRDAFSYGMSHGLWCVGSGWALMLFPMLLPDWHNLAMFVVTLIMFSEHLETASVVKWKFDMRLKLFGYIFAQSKMYLKEWSSS